MAAVRPCLAVASLVLTLTCAIVPSAYAGNNDLHPLREPSRDAARLRAQEAAKLKLIAKLRADAPRIAERATDAAATLEAPIFHRHDRP